MAKIEVKIPDNIFEFIKAFQEWHGDNVDPVAYARDAIRNSCEGDLDYIHSKTPAKAKKLVHDLRLGDIAISYWCYPPEDLVIEGTACQK